MQVVDAFSSSYAQARNKFLDATTRAGLPAQPYRHPLPGRDAETLALDEGGQAAISGGQYEIADGLFYGGSAPTWSNLTVRRVLREHASQAAQVAWIDLHTGLGASAACERGFAGPGADAAGLARARQWWGGAGATPVTLIGG